MIYTEYEVVYFRDPRSGLVPVQEYIKALQERDRSKVAKYIEYLRVHDGVLDEPYTRHIRGKLRELRVDFARNRHRIIYFLPIGKRIVLLHAFFKRTPKTLESEIVRAEQRMQIYLTYITNNEYEKK